MAPKSVLSLVSVVAMLGLGAALSGCTTTEGTNAFADPATFERDVMSETLKGMGVIPREEKPEITTPRGPLVLPKPGAALPAPQKSNDQLVAALPKDSSKAALNVEGLSAADLQRLKNIRVVDPTSLSGRPLTTAEITQLTSRMTSARVQAGPRPLYLPPVDYFTVVAGKEMVCMAKSGELVPLDDPACPPEVKKALLAKAN
jgi:hypothetical protein